MVLLIYRISRYYDPIFKTWKVAQGTLSLGRSYAGVAVVDKPGILQQLLLLVNHKLITFEYNG